MAFSTSTILTYASFAWLPDMLGDLAGTTPTEGGVLLAVTGLVSVPGALLAPLLVARFRNVGWLIAVGVVSFVLGYLGLLVVPTPLTLLWVLLVGLGSILFPVCLVLINARTGTAAGTVALSGFAQGIAYALGALGPLLVGLLHDVSGTWTLPLLFLIAIALLAIVPAITLARPGLVEDEARPVAQTARIIHAENVSEGWSRALSEGQTVAGTDAGWRVNARRRTMYSCTAIITATTTSTWPKPDALW